MLRPVMTLAAVGAVGLVAWQLLWTLVLPLLVGVVALVVKLLFWAVVFAFAIWIFRRLAKGAENPA